MTQLGPIQPEIDAAGLVGELWPTIGPHTPERIVQAARAVDQLWRYLAHATRDDSGLDLHALNETAGALAHAAATADQVYRQLSDASTALATSADIRHDRDRTIESATYNADAAAGALSAAAVHAAEQARMAETAFDKLSHLYMASGPDDT